MRARSILALVAILAIHVGLRWYFLETRPLAGLAIYPHCYSSSLSILSGHGFRRLPLQEGTSSQPVKDFLDLKKETLSRAELQAFLDDAATPGPGAVGSYPYLDTTQALAVYSAAAVWRCFGISWKALEGFYLGLSTCAMLCVFFVSRHISGNNKAALFSALLFAVSYESWAGMVWPRDLNPLWFAAFTFAALFGLVDRAQSPQRLWGSMFLLGVVAAVGYGFRGDCLILPPFAMAAAVPLMKRQGFSWKQVVMGVAATAVASQMVLHMVRGSYDQPPAMSHNFHMAYFGNQARCDLLGAENSFQIFRDDSKVASDAMAFNPAPLEYVSEQYGAVTWRMYLSAFPYYAYHWVSRIPLALWTAATSQPAAETFGRPFSFPSLALPLAVTHALLIGLMVVGALGALLDRPNRLAVSITVTFFVYYTAVWFAVDPHPRHWGQLLVPSCVLTAVGLGILLDLGQGQRFKLHKASLAWLGAVLLLWLCLCAVAWQVSSKARSRYLQEITALSSGLEVGTVDPKTFVASSEGVEKDSRDGYLLTIESGPGPAALICKHLRLSEEPFVLAGWLPDNSESPYSWSRKTIWWNSFLESRHRLAARGTQQFFVTFTRNYQAGDHRRYDLRILLEGDARIVRAQKFALTGWKGLQFSSVLTAEDSVAPVADRPNSRALLQFPTEPARLEELGFPGPGTGPSAP